MSGQTTTTAVGQDELLIGDFARWWRLRQMAGSTIRNYVYSLERISEWLRARGTDLTEAKRRDLEAFLEQRYTEVAPRTAHTDYKAMRAFYKWAVADEDVEVWKNPTTGIPGPSIPTEETEAAPVAVDESVYEALIRTCRTSSTMNRDARAVAVRDKAIITLLWWTGMRREEVSRLDMSDVDLDAGSIKVRKSKTGRPREVPILSRDLMEVLDRWLRFRRVYRANDEALFIGFGRNGKLGRGRFLANGITHMLGNRSKAAGVHTPAHTFRRGRTEQLERDGADPIDVERMLGWADGRQRRRYTRANGQRISNDALRALYGDA